MITLCAICKKEINEDWVRANVKGKGQCHVICYYRERNND